MLRLHLLLLLLLLLLLVLRIRTLRNQSEERRRTCSRWLSSYLTGELATTWPRLTGMKSLMKSPKSISTRMEDMARHGELLIKVACQQQMLRRKLVEFTSAVGGTSQML